MSAGGYRVEALRAAPEGDLAEGLVAFWTKSGALVEAEARERLAQVVCVAFGPDGEIAGVNSADDDAAPLVKRRFWIYRRFFAPGAPAGLETDMLTAAYEELARRFAESGTGPVGVCAVYRDSGVIERERDAVWANGFVYAGYTDAGAQVRIHYFDGGEVA